MVIRDQRQALCVAVEMEKRAIRVYERALMLVKDPLVKKNIQSLLSDEREHLQRFSSMKDGCKDDEREEKLLLQALAAEMLFPGGVMEMERAEGLNTIQGLYAFAAQSEQDAVEKYAAFAKKCEDERIKQAFLSIAKEEANHLVELKEKLEASR